MCDRGSTRATMCVAALTLLAAACEPPLAPDEIDPQYARGAGPSVEAADPPETVQDTTLDVRVIGSGFDDGSTVRFLINGQSAPKMLVNSATYVDRNTLIANVTVEPDAELALYDIEVTSLRGKKGVGTELFRVKEKPRPNEDPILPDETTWIEVGTSELQADGDPVGDIWGYWREIGPVGETFTAGPITMNLDWFRQRFGECLQETFYPGSLTMTRSGSAGEVRFTFTAYETDGVTRASYELIMSGVGTGPWPAETNTLSTVTLTNWEMVQRYNGPKKNLCLGEGQFDNATPVHVFPVPEHGPTDPIAPFMRSPLGSDHPVSVIADHTDDDNRRVAFWGESVRNADALAVYAWAAPVGEPVLAVADGVVIVSRADPPHYACGQLVIDRPFVVIEHTLPDGRKVASVYKGLMGYDVTVGQLVSAGEQIGRAQGNPIPCGSWTVSFEVRVENPGGYNFATRYYTWTDPYGWSGPGPDPLVDRMRGTNSHVLWVPGQAPALYREAVETNPDPASPVWMTRVRTLGIDDASNPNNEFAEIELNPGLNPSGVLDLTGYELRSLATGATYLFPAAFTLTTASPVRVYSGSGADTATELYWGMASGVYPNTSEACAGLYDPSGAEIGRLCR